MFLLFTYGAIAIGISFLCSILEAALLSLKTATIGRLMEERPATGKVLADLRENIDRPLSAILTYNTAAHTLGAAGVGAEAQRLWGSTAITIASAVMTVAVLFVSEIIPKTLGALHAERFAKAVSILLPWMVWTAYPIVVVSETFTRRLRSERDSKPTRVSREEVAALARLGGVQGVIQESELRVLGNLFRMSELSAYDIMTPRTVVFALPDTTTIGEAISEERNASFSRIPIYEKDLDHVVGYALRGEILLRAARGEMDVKVRDLTREMLVVPASLPLPALFERFLSRREPIAIVVDEYGGVDGVVTMEDVLETLLGMEIVDEADTVHDLREMARKRWLAIEKRRGGKT
jgi:CBS domain containing-hemolysin-like protein